MNLETLKKIIEKEQEITAFYRGADELGIGLCETVASRCYGFMNDTLWIELIGEENHHLLVWFMMDNKYGERGLEYTHADDGISFKCNDIETLYKRIF